MNHSGDANKMVETPRTDARVKQMIDNDQGPEGLEYWARDLERELNAANQRIKQLEAVVNDPQALWSNWLRGTVKLPSGIGDVRQYQERIKRLEEALDTLTLVVGLTPIVGNKDALQEAMDMARAELKAKEDKP